MPNQFLGDIPEGSALGQGPFREVRLLIDGQVAGAVFPYATIFTGGFTPPCWRLVYLDWWTFFGCEKNGCDADILLVES